MGCEGLQLRGEEEGRAVPLDPAEEDYQRRTVQEKRPVLGTCWGRGWAEAGGAAPLSSSFALKTKKVHGEHCEWKDVKSCISGWVQRKPIVARPPATGEGLPTPATGTQRLRAAGPRVRLRKAWSRAVLVAKEAALGTHAGGESLPRRSDPAGFLELVELHNLQGHSCPLDNSRNSSRRKATSS